MGKDCFIKKNFIDIDFSPYSLNKRFALVDGFLDSPEHSSQLHDSGLLLGTGFRQL